MTVRSTVARRPLLFAEERMLQGGLVDFLLVRRYAPGDEHKLELRGDFLAAWDASGHALPPGLRWTLSRGFHGPMAIGGLEPLRPGVFGAWGLASDLDLRAWVFVRRAARKVLEFAERELNAREIHAQACATPAAIGLLLQLGFERAGDPWEGPDGALYVPMLRSF